MAEQAKELSRGLLITVVDDTEEGGGTGVIADDGTTKEEALRTPTSSPPLDSLEGNDEEVPLDGKPAGMVEVK